MDSQISITLNYDLPDEQGSQTYVFTIRGKDWEINVVMTEAELMLLPKVRMARWSERTCLHIGKCAGVQTCWSCDEGNLSILIGKDDECWQFGVLMPETEIDNIIAKIKRETTIFENLSDTHV